MGAVARAAGKDPEGEGDRRAEAEGRGGGETEEG